MAWRPPPGRRAGPGTQAPGQAQAARRDSSSAAAECEVPSHKFVTSRLRLAARPSGPRPGPGPGRAARRPKKPAAAAGLTGNDAGYQTLASEQAGPGRPAEDSDAEAPGPGRPGTAAW